MPRGEYVYFFKWARGGRARVSAQWLYGESPKHLEGLEGLEDLEDLEGLEGLDRSFFVLLRVLPHVSQRHPHAVPH